MIEGVYGIKAKLPAVAGNEGVAVVREVGSNVKGLKVGDWVIPRGGAFGTWREEAVVDQELVDKIPNDIPRPYAAIIGVNPSTAYRLLKDFGNLKPGDWVIQNGANSMVGLAVVQIAALLGLKTINIVRSDKPEPYIFNDLRLLDKLGGTFNVRSDFLKTSDWREIISELDGPIKLGLNCVGGEVTADMARVLSYNGTFVTYGGMAKQPVVIPQEVINYKNLNVTGFWLTEWVKNNDRESRSIMLEDLAGWIREERLTLFTELHDFDDFDWALKRALLPYSFRKIVLNMDYPDRMAQHDYLSSTPELKNEHYFRFEADADHYDGDS
eukprot:CAMPEP_0174821222 /NCGR_PEP_ID=MMETSP1107-20130205/6070_1 /TAXON_ID=36770 /ORGANISM="Paraphysomonas vestita, Strain GFlagA" /LENGTH=325 /DNA_ID=CAMNT_0016038017 /DNA_START=188 /DNA_END=1165 /DNA_ORIENTATION=-